MTGTNYAYTYTDGGRLRSAKAATGSTLNSLLCLSFNRNKNFTPGASFGNLERVRDQAPATPAIDLYSYSGTDIATSGAGPDAPASIGPQQGSPTNAFGYDYAGRIVSKSSGGEALTYDPLGRLTSITRANAPGEALTYGPLGQLVGRLSGSTLTYYVGGAATVSTAKPSGCTAPGCALDTPTPPITVDVHLYAGGRRIATVRAGTSATGRILYYHRDRLGSVVATSTDGGVARATYRYDVYGSMTLQTESPDTASELGFTGALRLTGGLYVMGMRIYDAGLRQFLQPDVLNPMSYTYAGGDPVNRFDPTGMLDEPAHQYDHGDSGIDSGVFDGVGCDTPHRTCGVEEISITGNRPHAAGGHHNVSELPNGANRERGGGGGGGHGGVRGKIVQQRRLRPVERQIMRAVLKANELKQIDFGAVIVRFMQGLKLQTTNVCESGCDSAQDSLEPNTIIIDASLVGTQDSQSFYSVLVHELGHVEIFQTNFNSNIAAYDEYARMYQESGLPHDKQPWEQFANGLRDWYLGAEGGG